MIDIVADEADLVGEVHFFKRLQQDRVSGPVVAKQIDQGETFGRAVLEMAHVHVGPSAVEKKSSVAGRLVPVALVHVRQSEPVLFKNPITDPADGAGRSGGVVGQTTILRFQANNAVHKTNWPSESSW